MQRLRNLYDWLREAPSNILRHRSISLEMNFGDYSGQMVIAWICVTLQPLGLTVSGNTCKGFRLEGFDMWNVTGAAQLVPGQKLAKGIPVEQLPRLGQFRPHVLELADPLASCFALVVPAATGSFFERGCGEGA